MRWRTNFGVEDGKLSGIGLPKKVTLGELVEVGCIPWKLYRERQSAGYKMGAAAPGGGPESNTLYNVLIMHS